MNWYAPSSLNLDYDSEKELGEDTGFMENFNASFDHEQAENLSNSESIAMMEDVNNAYAALHEYTGQARFDTLSSYGNEVAGFDIDLRDLDAEQDLIIKLRQQHPDDTRLRTYSQMIADKKPELKALRERSQGVYDRAGVMGTVGTFLGTMGAHVKDPLFMYSLPFGAGPTTAKTALGRAVQVGAKEAAVAFVAEVPVTYSRWQWKKEIESPWTVWDAAEETLMVMAGTGLLSGVGYAIGDALGWTHAAKVARENGLEGEAQLLEKRAKKIDEANAHGVDVDELLQAEDEALQKVLTYTDVWHGSPHKFEQPDLSKMGTGEGAQAFGWGFYTAEARGVGEGYRKDLSGYDELVINKPDGDIRGEQLDDIDLEVAKYLEVGAKDAGQFPHNTVYYAKRAAVNKPEVLERLEKYGKDARMGYEKNRGHLYKLQVSDENIGKMLDWDKPLSEQSDIIRDGIDSVIEKVWQHKKDTPLWKGKSKEDFIDSELQTGDDLYSYLESITITPQKIVKRFDSRDEAVGFFKAEKQRFKDSPMSSGKGTYEPVAKLDGDEFTVETYDQFGKTHGQQAASEYLNSLGIPGIKYLDGSSRADGKGTRNYVVFDEKNITALERNGESLSPAMDKPVRLQELNDIEIAKVELDFKSKQATLNLTPEEYRKAAQIPQKQLAVIGEELEGVMGESIAFLNPGLKDLAKIEGKINRKGYDGTGDLTDVIRAGFIVKDATDIPQIIEAIAIRYEVLDEGIVVNASGYRDQKLLVRFDNGLVGELQIWDPHLLAAKSGAEFVQDVFPRHLQEYASDMDIPPGKDSGHALYEKQRGLLEDGEIKPSKHDEFKVLEKAMQHLYGDAKRFANTSWNELSASGRPESRISSGETFSHSPGSADARINQPDNPPSGGSTVTAGRPSQLKNSETSLKSNDAIANASTDIIPKSTNISKQSKYNADLEVPGTPILEGSEITATVRSYSEVMEEFDAEEQLWKDVETCMMGLSDGK